jgi:hypothetical protein
MRSSSNLGRCSVVIQMGIDARGRLPKAVVVLCLAYAMASLIHFAHNAEFLADYPNMPDWMSRAKVYAAWLGLTAAGVVGYVLFYRGFQRAGLLVIAIYAALGFDSLTHYLVAPFAAHTAMMHFTIWLDVATAAVLLVAAVYLAWKASDSRAPSL